MELDQVQLTILLRVFLAFVAGLVVGYDRERSGKSAGIRTQMLVCVGSALLSGMSVYLDDMYHKPNSDPARLMAQIVSGIGFLGAGVILKNGGSKVVGVTTAATIWITAAIGMAIGAGFYYPAFFSVVLVLMLNPLAVYQYRIGLKGNDYLLEIKKSDAERVSKMLKQAKLQIKTEKNSSRKLLYTIVSSEQRNQVLMEMLDRRKLVYKLEVLKDE